MTWASFASFCLKQRSLSCDGRKLAARLRKLPTPVLSGSGSRVFLSPAILRSTPVSMIQLKHCGRRKANGTSDGRQVLWAREFATVEFVRSHPFAQKRAKGWGTDAGFCCRITNARWVLPEPVRRGSRRARAERPAKRSRRGREPPSWPAAPRSRPGARDNLPCGNRTVRG